MAKLDGLDSFKIGWPVFKQAASLHAGQLSYWLAGKLASGLHRVNQHLFRLKTLASRLYNHSSLKLAGRLKNGLAGFTMGKNRRLAFKKSAFQRGVWKWCGRGALKQLNCLKMIWVGNSSATYIIHTHIIYILEKWFPLQGERAHSLKNTSFRYQIKVFDIKSKLNSFFFCSSFFLRLQGQPELCGCYHLLQSCFSFYVLLHANLSCLLATTLYRDAVHRYRDAVHRYRDTVHRYRDISLQLIFITSLQSFESGLALILVNYLLLLTTFSSSSCSYFCSFSLSFSRLILNLSLLRSSVTEALFALSFSFLSELCLFFLASFSTMLKLLYRIV